MIYLAAVGLILWLVSPALGETWCAYYNPDSGHLYSIGSVRENECPEVDGLKARQLNGRVDMDNVMWDDKELDFVPRPTPEPEPSIIERVMNHEAIRSLPRPAREAVKRALEEVLGPEGV